jgi:hypothetical protein
MLLTLLPRDGGGDHHIEIVLSFRMCGAIERLPFLYSEYSRFGKRIQKSKVKRQKDYSF